MPTKKRELISIGVAARDVPDWFRQHAGYLETILNRMQQRLEVAMGVRGTPVMSHDLEMDGHRVRGGADPLVPTDYVTLAYLEARALLQTQGTYVLNAPLNANGQRFSNLPRSRGSSDAETRHGAEEEATDALAAFLATANLWTALQTFTAGISLGNETLSVYDEGTFSVTSTEFTVTQVGTASYVQVGKRVTLYLPQIVGTSNATTFTLTGIPAGLLPTQTSWQAARTMDNTVVTAVGALRLNAASGTIDVFPTMAAGAWTAAGTKRLSSMVVPYLIL